MRRLLFLVLIVGMLGVAAIGLAGGSGESAATNHQDVTGDRVAAKAHQIRPVPQPPPGFELSERELNAISTSHEGLQAVEVPGVGVVVDLKGRFRQLEMAPLRTAVCAGSGGHVADRTAERSGTDD
jgi:hypothetical protein